MRKLKNGVKATLPIVVDEGDDLLANTVCAKVIFRAAFQAIHEQQQENSLREYADWLESRYYDPVANAQCS